VLPAASALPADTRAPAPRRRLARRLLVVAAFALVLTSCSTNHGPKSFDDEIVQSNFLTSCKETNPDKKDIADAVQFCDCVWAKVKETYTFDEFKTLDNKLRDALAKSDTAPKTAADLNTIDTRYVGVVEGCRTTGPSAPGSNASTTTLATTTTAK
jgi:hypothetical protein